VNNETAGSSKGSGSSSSKSGSGTMGSNGAGASATTFGGREVWRRRVEQQLLPALRAFSPDLILISAGFDGAKYDAGNRCLSTDKMGLDLEPSDFEWISQKIQAIANVCCNGRVISVLEGGYGCKKNILKSSLKPGKHLSRKVLSNCQNSPRRPNAAKVSVRVEKRKNGKIMIYTGSQSTAAALETNSVKSDSSGSDKAPTPKGEDAAAKTDESEKTDVDGEGKLHLGIFRRCVARHVRGLTGFFYSDIRKH